MEINKELLFYWLYLFTLQFAQLFFSIHLFVACGSACLQVPANIRLGRAIAQAVSRWLHTTAAWVQTRV
jgi:hypothetical protein